MRILKCVIKRMITLDEFISFKDVQIKDQEHKKVIKLFYQYLQSVSGSNRSLPSIIGHILGLDLTSETVLTGCFNGVNDGTTPPYDSVDFYIKLSNNIKVYVYGKEFNDSAKLNESEYVVFAIAEEISDNIIMKENRHIYLL